MLKNVARYLQKTKTWEIRYKRSATCKILPEREYDFQKLPENFPKFPVEMNKPVLIGFVDAAHANDLRKR